MRKISIALLLLVVTATTAMAQGKKRTGFRIGVNYAYQQVEISRDKEGSDPKTGLSIALFQEIPLNNQLDFQPEIAYNRMGGEFEDVKTRLDYISIPLLFRVHGKRFGFAVGPQVSLLVNAKEKDEFDNTTDLKDAYKSADVSTVAGFDYSLGKNNRFVIAARYVFGMNDVIKNSGSGNSVRNRGGQLTVGFRF